METQKFEESFREAFRGAEVRPTQAVWVNVELDLERASGGKMKGRLLFFQLLAAASMLFAMGTAGVYYMKNVPDYNQPRVQQKSIAVLPQVEENKNSLEKTETPSRVEATNPNLKKQVKPSINKGDGSTGVSSAFSSDVAVASEQNNSLDIGERKFVGKERPLPDLVHIENPQLMIPTTEPDPGMVMLAKLKDEEKKYQKEKPDVMEKLWTSVGMGAGTYNPNASSSIANLNSFGNAATSSDPSTGSSYSVGVNVARKISKRIVIQGGISYLSQNAEYTSNAAAGRNASLNEYVGANKKLMTATSPYKVNSNLQYMSIPVQAGFIIIDHTFAVQLNGGISTDIFFQSTLTPEKSDLNKVTQKAGDESPYRTLNFSGLMGTELSYKLGDHYRIAVNPGLRYALNSIYKAEVATETSPITFDVGLKFRYIFN